MTINQSIKTTMFVTEDLDSLADAVTANTGTGHVATSTISANDGQTHFTIGRQLTEQQQRQLADLLSEYSGVFTEIPGKCDLVQHQIQLTDDRPIWQPQYRFPEGLKDAIESEIHSMLEQGIIQYDYESKYNSPLMAIRKKDGGIRLVNNFVELNKHTVPEHYPMANANELLNKVAKKCISDKNGPPEILLSAACGA